jgi:hypothetical protein
MIAMQDVDDVLFLWGFFLLKTRDREFLPIFIKFSEK